MSGQQSDLDKWQVPAGTKRYGVRIKSLAIVVENKPVFDEDTLIIGIDDQAAGEFVTLANTTGEQHISIDPTQWPVVRDAIDFMTQHCRSDKEIS